MPKESYPIIDFRARPNTAQVMKDYVGEGTERMWEFFDHLAPTGVALKDYVAALEENGIDHAVFTGRQRRTNGALTRGVDNDYIADCVRRYPGRLIGVAGVDPTDGIVAAVAEVNRAVGELGLAGVALDPDAAKSCPDDRIFYPIYAAAAERSVPVVLTLGPLVGRFANPAAVDRVAEDFPELTIVCSHGCWPQVTELIGLAYRHPNVYLELSLYEFLPGAEPVIAAANSVIQNQVLYASAFPFNGLDTIDRFRQLPFEPNVLRKLLFENPANVLGLAQSATT